VTRARTQLQARRDLDDRVRIARDDVTERLLLRACLLPDQRAVDAWRAWRDRARPVNDLPTEQHRLVPLLHANLTALGVEDPDVTRYAGVRRFYWIHQQAMLRSVRPAIETMHEAGVRLMLIKSLPILSIYPRPELRPTSDLDVWVHPDDVPRALELLRAHGFTPLHRRLRDPRAQARAFEVQHAAALRNSDARVEIDVHTRLHKGLPSLALGVELYAKADRVAFGEHTLPAVPLAGSVLHTAVHAHDMGSRLFLRGVVDIAMLIRSPAVTIDWEEVLRLARAARAVTPLTRIVRFAYALLEEELPAPLEQILRTTKVERSDRVLWNLSSAPGPFAMERRLALYYVRAREVAPADGLARLGPLEFLRGIMHAPSRWATVGLVLRHPVKRVWRWVRGQRGA
jgi:hypothetical protein